MPEYLHDHREFADLIRIIEEESGIDAALIEKDYYIMHALYGLSAQSFDFKLKGGTSLSKGYRIIDRFSEDIDIYIIPPDHLDVNINPKSNKTAAVESRKTFYDWLASAIGIPGLKAERDLAYDDIHSYRSGGIRLYYEPRFPNIVGVKEGILLEAGFSKITPNQPVDISSWAYDKALTAKVKIEDNRAKQIACYHPGYTFVEKLQTIATKFRQELEDGVERPNYMRQYYDIYRLLENGEVLDFIGTKEYLAHKAHHFPKADFVIPIYENPAFLLTDKVLRNRFKQRYQSTAALYYKGQPDFDQVMERIRQFVIQL